MATSLVEIKGFEELQRKIKNLPDKVKKREVNKILIRVAHPTLLAARNLAPVSEKPHQFKRRNKNGSIYTLASGLYIQPGTGRRSLAKKVMTRSREPYVTVSPRSRKTADGFYLRQWVIPGTRGRKGTKGIEPNNFIEQAEDQTKHTAIANAETKLARHIQKQINKL